MSDIIIADKFKDFFHIDEFLFSNVFESCGESGKIFLIEQEIPSSYNPSFPVFAGYMGHKYIDSLAIINGFHMYRFNQKPQILNIRQAEFKEIRDEETALFDYFQISTPNFKVRGLEYVGQKALENIKPKGVLVMICNEANVQGLENFTSHVQGKEDLVAGKVICAKDTCCSGEPYFLNYFHRIN